MAWIGKIIGGTVGLFMGGPLGMIAGAAFGHMIDSTGEGQAGQGTGNQRRIWEEQQRRRQGGPFSQSAGTAFSADRRQQQSQMVFFVGAFSMLAKIASADGSITQAERKKVEEFVNQDLRLYGQSKEAALRIFETALNEKGSFHEFAQQYYQQFRNENQMLQLMIDIMYRVALADGRMTSAEDKLISSAAQIFHLPDSIIDMIRKRYMKNVSGKTYAVLGVSPDASDDEIKKAYRKLVSDYHPDKIASKGLPDEFNKFAEEKFREVQSAYEEIREERGF